MASTIASADDLAARNITVPESMSADALLASATDAIRDAAHSMISQTTSTVTFPTWEREWLELPAKPVTEVASVAVGGVEITGWELFGRELKMPVGWTKTLPVNVTVTFTHGYATIPADIVDLCCGIVAMAASTKGGGYGPGSRVQSNTTGGVSRTWFSQPVQSPSPVTLPEILREQLRERFGDSLYVVGSTR